MVALAATSIATPLVLLSQQVNGNVGPIVTRTAPVATFENDIYVARWTNKTGNDEVMYRV